jgi:beta-1,4-mannosyl-glycoprotein beta-1,4-N-acetylglucosaminyltransferase
MRIYDCSIFYNELEVLDYRLMTLYDYVDYFIIVELGITHRGIKRCFVFEENKDKYKKYMDKIIYIKIDEKKTYKGKLDYGIRKDFDDSIENFHRNCIMRGLRNFNLNDDDIILISDADEIISPNVLMNLDSLKITKIGKVHPYHKLRTIAYLFAIKPRKAKQLLFNNYTVAELLEEMPIVCEQDLYYYYINNIMNIKWHGTVIVKYKNIQSPQCLRDLRNALPCVKNAGWHFSYFGGMDKVKLKLNSVYELPPEKVTDEVVKQRMMSNKRGKWFFNGKAKFIDIEKVNIPNLKDFIKKYPYIEMKK